MKSQINFYLDWDNWFRKYSFVIYSLSAKSRSIFLSLSILIITLCDLSGQQAVNPKYIYLNNFDFKDTTLCKLNGPARIINFHGRQGLNTTSIHSVLEMKAHTLKQNQGTVTLWVLSLEDLSSYRDKANMDMNNPYFNNYPLLSDNLLPQNVESANFKFLWSTNWHPSLIVQFGKGNFYDDTFKYPHLAFVSVSHFTFQNKKWYQFALTWDHAREQYALYVNGILIGREDHFTQDKMRRDSINSSLYTGNPTLCYSDIRFYDQMLSEKEIYSRFKQEVTVFDPEFEKSLQYTYAGKNRKKFEFQPSGDWTKKMSVTLQSPSHIDSFYVQGLPIEVKITDKGLLIETINKQYTRALLDSQVYVWSRKVFEGDLYIEYEFKVLRPGGLSLLMVQASGMNREDFMADYPLKTSGQMRTVHGENVRNYHWEYYREMSDMRNDVQNSALAKNPFGFGLSFSELDQPVDYTQWNKLQFLQIGNKLVGAINGIVMVEFTDNGFINNGPVYNFGHIAIRCMLHSKMLFRNLKVYNRNDVEFTPVQTGN